MTDTNVTADFVYPIMINGEQIAEIEGRAEVELDVFEEWQVTNVDPDSIEFITSLSDRTDWQGKRVWNYTAPTKDDARGKALQEEIAAWIMGAGEKSVLDGLDHGEIRAGVIDAAAESRADFRNEV